MKVLIVNSVPVMKQTITQAMERQGYYHFEEADSIESAKTSMQERFDLIVTDLNLSDGWGMDLIEAIRSCPLNGNARLIVITHARHTDRIDELKACGVRHCLFLKRPSDLQRLETLIDDLLDRLPDRPPRPVLVEQPASKESFLEIYGSHEEGSTEIIGDRLIMAFDNARLSICLDDLLKHAKLEVMP